MPIGEGVIVNSVEFDDVVAPVAFANIGGDHLSPAHDGLFSTVDKADLGGALFGRALVPFYTSFSPCYRHITTERFASLFAVCCSAILELVIALVDATTVQGQERRAENPSS